MIEIREVTDVFLYFRFVLIFLSVASYLISRKPLSAFWKKQILGIEVSVIVLSAFNIAILFSALKEKILYDLIVLVLGIFFLYKLRQLEKVSDKTEKLKFYLSSLLSFSFWIVTVLYIALFPLALPPLR